VRRALLLCLGLLLAAGAALPLLAGAALDSRSDPNDTNGLLDVRRVEVGGSNRPRFKTITFARWSVGRIWDRGYVTVSIDARGDRRFEHYALIYSDGSRMQGLLYRTRRDGSERIVAPLSAWKPNPRSVTVRVPLARLRMPATRTFYRWFVKTLMTGSGCRRVCIDRAPDGGAVRTVLVPSPSPTISPSPTVVPSPSPSPSATPSPSP